jgi:hypothetical protein
MPSDVRLLDKGISETKKMKEAVLQHCKVTKQLGRDGLECYSLPEMVSDVTAWQRWPWMWYWRRWSQIWMLGRDGLICDSLAEVVSDVTVWRRRPRMWQLGRDGPQEWVHAQFLLVMIGCFTYQSSNSLCQRLVDSMSYEKVPYPPPFLYIRNNSVLLQCNNLSGYYFLWARFHWIVVVKSKYFCLFNEVGWICYNV